MTTKWTLDHLSLLATAQKIEVPIIEIRDSYPIADGFSPEVESGPELRS